MPSSPLVAPGVKFMSCSTTSASPRSTIAIGAIGSRCRLALDGVQIEEDAQRLRDRGLIFDDEDFHRSEGLAHRDASDQTLLVATAGETLAPRIAGGIVATSPLTHSSTIPTAT